MENTLFNEADQTRISAAVQQAERKTSGEIVPYYVEQSDNYEEAVWRGGALGCALAIVVLTGFHLFTETWHGLGLVEVVLWIVGAFGLGLALTHWIPPFKRLFAGDTIMEQRVAQRAAQAFIAEEVFETRDRTGILLFVSLLEHKVLVVGDSGINAKVGQSEWENVVAKMVRGINSGHPADGLVEAIEQCGLLLQKQGVKRRKDDSDELSNKLRTGSTRGSTKRRKRS